MVPDSQWIAFNDRDGRLWVASLANHAAKEIAHSTEGEIGDCAWSPGGGYLAFSMNDPSRFSALYIWSAKEDKLRRVTSGNFNEYTPAWDPGADYLYFLANHEFQPQLSQIEFNFATNRSRGIFVLALRKDGKNPFPVESDEVAIKKDEAAKEDDKTKDEKSKDEKAKDKKPEEPKDKGIDFDGLEQRVTRVPLDANNYTGLSVKTDALVYAVAAAPYYGRPAAIKSSLRIFSFKDRKETTLADDITGFAISWDGSKALVHQGPAWNVYDATPAGAASKKTVSTAGLMVEKVPTEEWKQIFNEVWRRYRDFFYAPTMHGDDWEAPPELQPASTRRRAPL